MATELHGPVPRGSRHLAALAATILLAACQSGAPPSAAASPSSEAESASPQASATEAIPPTAIPTTTPLSGATAPPNRTPEATLAPSPSPSAPQGNAPELLLVGDWVAPTAGATLRSYSTTLAARVYSVGWGTWTTTKVVFSVSWSGVASRVACVAMKPGSDHVWSCTANFLALGVPPGHVTLAFNVLGVGRGGDADYALSPETALDVPREITYAIAPPRPTNVRAQVISNVTEGDTQTIIEQVSWSAPAGYAMSFRWIGVRTCPNESAENEQSAPCLLEGTPIAEADQRVIATAGGSERSMTWTTVLHPIPALGWSTINGSEYYATVLEAANAYGTSAFAIVESAPVPCQHTCTY